MSEMEHSATTTMIDTVDHKRAVSKISCLWIGKREFCSRFRFCSCGFEADGVNEIIQSMGDALVESVKLRKALLV